MSDGITTIRVRGGHVAKRNRQPGRTWDVIGGSGAVWVTTVEVCRTVGESKFKIDGDWLIEFSNWLDEEVMIGTISRMDARIAFKQGWDKGRQNFTGQLPLLIAQE